MMSMTGFSEIHKSSKSVSNFPCHQIWRVFVLSKSLTYLLGILEHSWGTLEHLVLQCLVFMIKGYSNQILTFQDTLFEFSVVV